MKAPSFFPFSPTPTPTTNIFAPSHSQTQTATALRDKHAQRACPETFGTNIFQLHSNNTYIEVFKHSQVDHNTLVAVCKIEEHTSLIVDYDFIIQNQQLKIVYVTQRGDVVVYQSKDKAMFGFYHVWSGNVKGECLCVSANPYEGCNEEFIVTCKGGNVYYYKYNDNTSEYNVKEVSSVFNRMEICDVQWNYVYGWECYFMKVWSNNNNATTLIKVNDDFTKGEANPIDEDICKLFQQH